MGWDDVKRTVEYRFDMVSQTNIAQTLGTLDGVVLDGSSLTAAYYSDTRTAGTVKLHGGNWVRGSFVRVTAEVPELGWRRSLGTYLATSDDAERMRGAWDTTLELRSMLFALSTDLAPSPWTVRKGAYAVSAMRQMLDSRKRPYRMLSPLDHRFSSDVVYEVGKPYLEDMFALCKAAGDRLDVDGEGYVTVAPYAAPQSRVPSMTIDATGASAIVDGISRSTDWLSMPSRTVVQHTFSQTSGGKSVQKEVHGMYDSPGHTSRASRGYIVTEFQSVSDMQPETWRRATELARQYQLANEREQVEWELETMFLPLWEGDVVDLVLPEGEAGNAYGGRRKCLVKGVDLDLGKSTMKLTLKETASGDDGE